jgi:hypothetical protein
MLFFWEKKNMNITWSKWKFALYLLATFIPARLVLGGLVLYEKVTWANLEQWFATATRHAQGWLPPLWVWLLLAGTISIVILWKVPQWQASSLTVSS